MGAFKSVFIVGLGIIIIWFLFHDTGGLLGGATNNSGFSRNNSAGSESSETIGTYGSVIGASPFAGQVELLRGSAYNDDRDREYIELQASDSLAGSITISGWTLQNLSRDKEYEIPESPRIGYPFENQEERPVELSAGETAYVITGFSPIGTSFKTNECTGYFQDETSFRPSLGRDCPTHDQKRVLKKFNLDTNEECIEYLDRIPRCHDEEVPRYDDDDPNKLPNRCLDYIREEVNYEGCVRNNVTTSDFYGSEWYLYLEVRFTIDEIWKDDNIILLLDHSGLVVDELVL